MKKFAPLMIAAAAMSSLAGCVAESSPSEMTAEDQAATCTNGEGTNAAIAAVAVAMAQELHRWQLLSDFYVYNGFNNQQMLGLTSAGLAACGGSCPITANLLAFQDSRMNEKAVFDGTKLNSWNFASRIVTGYNNMKACQPNNQCPFPAHVLGWHSNGTYSNTSAPGSCDTVYTFNVNKPTAQNHATLNATEMAQLANALKWTTGNGPNPYINFKNTSSTVSIDPSGNMNPPGQTGGVELCQKFSATDANGTACTCTARAIANGFLHNDDTATPKTYYCR